MCGAPSNCHALVFPQVGAPGLSSVGGPGWGSSKRGGGVPSRELLSAVNKQQKTELPGSLLGDVCWGEWGSSLFLAVRSHQEGHTAGLMRGALLGPLPNLPPAAGAWAHQPSWVASPSPHRLSPVTATVCAAFISIRK